MNKENLYEVAEVMMEQLGTETLLTEILQAMDVDELKVNLEYIDRMHDLNNFNEEDGSQDWGNVLSKYEF